MPLLLQFEYIIFTYLVQNEHFIFIRKTFTNATLCFRRTRSSIMTIANIYMKYEKKTSLSYRLAFRSKEGKISKTAIIRHRQWTLSRHRFFYLHPFAVFFHFPLTNSLFFRFRVPSVVVSARREMRTEMSL